VTEIRALIVDDEPIARRLLRRLLGAHADVIVVGEAGNGSETIELVRSLRPDLVFLDIEMPDMDGLSVVDQIEPDVLPLVVFVTAYDRYAVEAFRIHALDYLLKPFDDGRLAEALATCRRRLAEISRLERGDDADRSRSTVDAQLASCDHRRPGPYLDRLVVRSLGRIFFLKVATIDWIEACADYVNLHVADRTWLLRRTMTDLEAKLDPGAFARISRFAIVNMERVQDLAPTPRGEHLVRLVGGREMKLTRGYREKFEALLGDRL
jgi:two-component system LytT family response regulator